MEYPVETASFHQIYYDPMEYDESRDTSANATSALGPSFSGINTSSSSAVPVSSGSVVGLGPPLNYDDPDSEMYSRIMAATNYQSSTLNANGVNATYPESFQESLHINDEIFFDNHMGSSTISNQNPNTVAISNNGPASGLTGPSMPDFSIPADYNYQFKTSSSPSASSSSSSIPVSLATLGTPDLSASATDKFQIDYQNSQTLLETPQINNLEGQLALLETPQIGAPLQHTFQSAGPGAISPPYAYHQSRHHSTTIPVDQLNLLSIKSLSVPHSASSTTLTSDQISKSPSPDYYYTSGDSTATVTGNTANSSAGTSSAGDIKYDFNYDFNLNLDTFTKELGFEPKLAAPKTEKRAKNIKNQPLPKGSRDAERTVNPRELFTSKIPTSLSSPALTTLFSTNQTPPSIKQNNFRALPSSMLFSKIPDLPNQAPSNPGKNSYRTPKFDFKMNDECYNAISYWLNNTLSSARSENDLAASESSPADEATKIMVNPTGIIKGSYSTFNNVVTPQTPPARRPQMSHSAFGGISKRRNSIQLSNPSTYSHDISTIAELRKNKVDEEDENEEVLLEASPVQPIPHMHAHSQSLSNIPIDTSQISAGQKKKRRKSSNTYEGQVQGQESPVRMAGTDFPKLEASLSYPQLSLEPISRARKLSTPAVPQVERFEAETPESKIQGPTVKGSGSSSNMVMSTVSVSPNAQGAFPCTECEKQFKRSEHLKRHIRSVHSNIRPFHCKYCEKKFSRSDNLAQHLKTHYRVDANGQTTIVYGTTTSHARGSTGSINGTPVKKKE